MSQPPRLALLAAAGLLLTLAVVFAWPRGLPDEGGSPPAMLSGTLIGSPDLGARAQAGGDEALGSPVLRARTETSESVPGRTPPGRDVIEGRVVDETGLPQRGVLVHLWHRIADGEERLAWGMPPALQEIGRALTDEEGSFRFAPVHVKRCGLTAEAGSATEQRFPIVPGSLVEIRLGSGNRIDGRAICSGHGAELFEGTVVLALDGGFEPWVSVPIAPDGSFFFSSLPPGAYDMIARVKAHACGGMNTLHLEGWQQRRTVELPAEPGVVITGKVVHATSGEPIAGAEVRSMFSDIHSALTDAAGEFRMDQVPSYLVEFEDQKLHVTKHEFVPATVKIKAGEDLVIRLEPEAILTLAVTGRLLRADGQPAVGVRVSAEDQPFMGKESTRPPLFRSVRTAADGHFALPWREKEDFHLTLTDLEGESYLLFLGNLAVSRDLGEVRLPEVRQYSFIVQDESGVAVAGADVDADQTVSFPSARPTHPNFLHGPIPFTGSKNVLTDSFGRCALRVAPMEDGSISVRLGFYGQWSFPLPATGTVEQRLVLENLRSVRGRVRHASGDPVTHGWLNLQDLASSPANPFAELRDPFRSGDFFDLAEDGSFLIHGRYSASLTGSLTFFDENLRGRMLLPELRLDQGPLEIVVPELTPIVGFVRDAAGQPIVGARLVLLGDHGLEWRAAASGADGSFSLRVLNEPNLRLVAVLDERRSEEQPIAAASSLLFVLADAE